MVPFVIRADKTNRPFIHQKLRTVPLPCLQMCSFGDLFMFTSHPHPAANKCFSSFSSPVSMVAFFSFLFGARGRLINPPGPTSCIGAEERSQMGKTNGTYCHLHIMYPLPWFMNYIWRALGTHAPCYPLGIG